MLTTLPLFWHLSSASKKERIDASVKLIGALERFQAEFTSKEVSVLTSEDEDDQETGGKVKGDGFDILNAQDVSYSIRRLVRGLASPRESSRLGFAVALTELLSLINTVTCSQLVTLILDSSKTQGSMTGQEERDVLFARLFGLVAVIQSGLLIRDTPLASSASSTTAVSSLSSYKEVLTQLIALGDKRSWLRESAWWTVGLAVDTVGTSNVSWKTESLDWTADNIFTDNKFWTPEKVALTLKLSKLHPSADWRKLLSPTFKQTDILNSANYSTLARILKDVNVDEDEDADIKLSSSSWKPQVHSVWDMLLDEVLSNPSSVKSSNGSFPEFFRILVDESLFSSSSSPERKYWGFQIFQKALPRVSASDMPMLFTKNFMRSWINHLSNSDRYLHKAAKQVATDIQALVKKNPTLGFALILQLTGVHGSHQFDKLTKTKTVETILTSMDNDGIQNYIKYLLEQVNDDNGSKMADIQRISARRTWIIDQLAALIRNGAIPKDDSWVQTILDWFTANGLFVVKKKSEKSPFLALHTVPSPPFSEELHKACRDRLLGCLAELTGHASAVKIDEKTVKVAAAASDGQFWVSRVLASIENLEMDSKHVNLLADINEEDRTLRYNSRQLADRLSRISGERQEAAKGAELLLSATLLYQYCMDDDDDNETDPGTLQSCIDGASRMFPLESKKSKKSRKSTGGGENDDDPEPVDVLVDIVIGFLEEATAYMRATANQVFSLLSGSVQESTIDLIVAQLERRNPAELAEEEDEGMEDEVGSEVGEEDHESESSDSDVLVDDDEDLDETEDPELRRKIEEALRVNGIHASTGDSGEESEEEFMDDDQMMAIDEQLATVFKARSDEKKLGKGVDAQREATHYKNRVLDLVDIFLKKQPSPYIVRLILPLVELVVNTSSDEKQLADKATGILRSRIGKSKDIPTGFDKDQVVTVLEELHVRARKASSSDVLSTLSQCSLYLSKALLHASEEAPVAKVYRESLDDFVTRKASRLNTAFLQDFVRRHTSTAWTLRADLVEATGKAINGYRQCQVFQLLGTLVNQLLAIGVSNAEILQFMPSLRQAIQESVTKACTDSATLTPQQMKDVLKLALSAARQTKRISSSPEEVATIWIPSSWDDMSKNIASSDTFKTSTGLQKLCKQLSQILGSKGKDAKDDVGGIASSKRKIDATDGAVAPRKPKRKKVKKNKG